MNSTTQVTSVGNSRINNGRGGVVGIARRGVLGKLRHLKLGQIDVVEGQEHYRFGTRCDAFPRTVRIVVHDPVFYPDIAFSGSIGAGESFMLGLWSCDDLVELMRILLRNPQVLDDINSGSARLKKPFYKLFHWLHRNTVKGSRKNIHAHYDLGNEFFKLFLDDTMMYSCAIFESPEMTLREASVAKLDRVCRKLDLKPGDHLLEIGTGWGGLAIHAAREYGCRVTTTTISEEQYKLAQERIQAAGLADRITLLKDDFRTLEGQYDKLVSIEMIEAVGESNIGTFFEVCNRCLKPGGRMLVQAITIADEFFDSYRKSVDFIQRFIFPGGFLPSVTFLSAKAGSQSGMRLMYLEDIGRHYATTLQRWREAFHRNTQAIQDLGYSRDFMRLWHFYFCYCEAGFLERTTGNVHMVLEKEKALEM